MEIIFEAYRKTKRLHHVYLIEDDDSGAFEKILFFVEKDIGISINGNPDVWVRSFEKFGIDEGRMIRNLQANKAVSGSKRVFIITSRFFTREAQNALLKVFEEPTENTHFFIITPRADALLPTLKSRLFIVSKEETGLSAKADNIDTAKKFLSSNVKERLGLVSSIIEGKDKASAMKFIDTLEQAMCKGNMKDLSGCTEILDDIIKIRGYLYGNAPSVKMICEYLCVAVPRLE